MAKGPQHPSIQAEVRLASRSARVRIGLGLIVLLALFWGLLQPDTVVEWTQTFVRTTLPELLRQVD